jgi:hypothetical protein
MKVLNLPLCSMQLQGFNRVTGCVSGRCPSKQETGILSLQCFETLEEICILEISSLPHLLLTTSWAAQEISKNPITKCPCTSGFSQPHSVTPSQSGWQSLWVSLCPGTDSLTCWTPSSMFHLNFTSKCLQEREKGKNWWLLIYLWRISFSGTFF